MLVTLEPRLLIAASLILALLGQGCAATVHRRQLPPLDVVIDSSDPDNLVVRVRNQRYRVPAEQVEDIDHPGNVLMVIGVSVFGLGALLGTAGLASRTEELAIPALGYGGIGLGLMIGGGIPWALSRGAASRFEEAAAKREPVILPIECAPLMGAGEGCPEPRPKDVLEPL